jgi:hypothetical protein
MKNQRRRHGAAGGGRARGRERRPFGGVADPRGVWVKV